MNSKLAQWLALCFIATTLAIRADDASPSVPPKPVIHVACVGDSITQGVGVKSKTNSYPAQLGRLLGEGWDVKNFGVSGTTMMSKGDRPYDKRKEYQAALDSKPDIAVIALGTNDSKPQNIDTNSESFLPSYRDMIVKFRAANPKIKIYACLPVPAFPEHWGIRDSVITNQIIPMIQQVAKEEHLPVIDLHTALAGKDACFPDLVHPNEEGAALMAKAVCEAIKPAAGHP
jgi:lysophospholipase L1-like esterase